MCFGLRPHANTVFGLKVTFGKRLPLFHGCAEFLARDVRDCGLTFFIYININKKGHLHLFTHELVFPIGSHWPKFVAHKLWGRDRWWGLEPPQVEHARPRAKYKLELTLGWVCWLWNAGHVFFLLISIHQIQKYLKNLKFVESAQWGLFSPPSEVGRPKLCYVYMLLTAPKHIYMWPASRTWFEVHL